MPISWFPGHMNKARKELGKLVKQSQGIIEILDCRVPNASRNPLLAEITADLPRIIVLSKSDLVSGDNAKAWQAYLQAESQTACLLSSLNQPISKSKILSTLARLWSSTATESKAKQIIVAGIPNVGKSTFINTTLGRKVANTGNEPAVTKGQQRVKLENNICLVDTPGLLWPKLEDQTAAYKLAALGTIKNTAIDLEEVAWFIGDFLLNNHIEALIARYGIDSDFNGAERLLEIIAASTGGINKGGKVDYHKASETLLNDLRSGKLGALCLEQP